MACCAACGAGEPEPAHECSGNCGRAFCSAACQRRDWLSVPLHRRYCAITRSLLPTQSLQGRIIMDAKHKDAKVLPDAFMRQLAVNGVRARGTGIHGPNVSEEDVQRVMDDVDVLTYAANRAFPKVHTTAAHAREIAADVRGTAGELYTRQLWRYVSKAARVAYAKERALFICTGRDMRRDRVIIPNVEDDPGFPGFAHWVGANESLLNDVALTDAAVAGQLLHDVDYVIKAAAARGHSSPAEPLTPAQERVIVEDARRAAEAGGDRSYASQLWRYATPEARDAFERHQDKVVVASSVDDEESSGDAVSDFEGEEDEPVDVEAVDDAREAGPMPDAVSIMDDFDNAPPVRGTKRVLLPPGRPVVAIVNAMHVMRTAQDMLTVENCAWAIVQACGLLYWDARADWPLDPAGLVIQATLIAIRIGFVLAPGRALAEDPTLLAFLENNWVRHKDAWTTDNLLAALALFRDLSPPAAYAYRILMMNFPTRL